MEKKIFEVNVIEFQIKKLRIHIFSWIINNYGRKFFFNQTIGEKISLFYLKISRLSTEHVQ